jgi:hypothetical protein
MGGVKRTEGYREVIERDRGQFLSETKSSEMEGFMLRRGREV